MNDQAAEDAPVRRGVRLDDVEEAIADIAAGKAVVVVDDEDRENEGDIIFAASKATPELMAFTIRHSSGVICVPMPADMLGRLVDNVARIQNDVLRPRGLRVTGMADREVRVLKLVADGMDTREIARELCYSERTVKNVLHDVVTKLNARSRSQAVAHAVREGLI